GRYLATIGDCTACHTAPGGKLMAGGRSIETPFGNIVSPNITPDRETGIGAWTDDQFYASMHDGTSADGDNLYPAMPYPHFTKVTRDDVMAIRAWLNTLEPVVNRVEANQLPFPFNIRAAMIGWNELFFTPGVWQDDPKKSAEWNRGGYLIKGLAHCGACHSAKNMLGADESGGHLQGYALQGWFAPAITSGDGVGLDKWTEDDIVEYLKTGTNRFATAAGPMAEAVSDSTQHISIADLRAMAAYLKDQRGPSGDKRKPMDAKDPVMRAGEAIYVDKCAACHTMNGEGIARLFPTLSASPTVEAENPLSVLHVILNGTRAVQTRLAPTAPAMPAFSWELTDAQVAAVATYVRNAWGNAAPAVTAGDVSSARKTLEARRE
ncbi:MAG: c-type cytochrome, partial [Rhodospirillales bacterium]|nr:c-type cytochrome [Rhodospirillales bacterium]